MSPAKPQDELEARLEALVSDHRREPGDRLSATDERSYFRQVDRVSRERDTDPKTLESLGTRYAQSFIVPYLRGEDAVSLISEIAALIEIHRRGTLRLHDFNETNDGAEAVLAFERIDAHGRHMSPTRFDLAIVRTALETRYKAVELVPIPSHGLVGERMHLRMLAPR